MKRQLIIVGIVLLVVFAGCNGQSAAQPQETEQSSPSTSMYQDTATPAPTTTTTPSPPNPWDSDELTVYVSSDIQDRNYTALARESISFWNTDTEDRASASYRVFPKLTLTDTPEDADITITYRPILDCAGVGGNIDDTRTYCTEFYKEGDTAADTTEIVVTSRYENETTINLTTNALAGLYGVTSAKPPAPLPETPNLTDPFITADTVVVAIDNEANPKRNFTPMVQEALEYWMANDDEYGTYTTEFRLQPDAEDADMVVHIRENVSYCGLHDRDTVLGCADFLNKQRGKEIPARVVIKSGFTDASTVTILKHELGHIYGLEHGSTPGPWMEPHFKVDELPKTDARDQENPWSPNPVTIAVDSNTYHDPEGIEGDLQHVITYFNELAPGGFYLKLVSEPADAHIVVREVSAHESECLDPGYASCAMPYGYSVDEDRALEEYTRMVIHTDNVDDDVVAWHVGYWIDTTVTPDELAEYWDDPRGDDRSDWW